MTLCDKLDKAVWTRKGAFERDVFESNGRSFLSRAEDDGMCSASWGRLCPAPVWQVSCSKSIELPLHTLEALKQPMAPATKRGKDKPWVAPSLT